MKKLQRGYTLIELMVVVVVIGILAALSIPAYLKFVSRSQITDGLALVGGLKTAVAEYYNTAQVFPVDRAALGLGVATDTQGEYVSSVDVENGNLVVLFGNAAAGDVANERLAIRPYLDNDQNISWLCGTADAPAGLTLGGALTTGTTVPADILPSNCRGNFNAVP